jgi:O-antigen/teichoic acid export membrane protein
MGPQFGEASGQLLRILLLPNLFGTASGIAANITFGLSKHRPVAIWQFVESLIDVALAVWLARSMGLEGVAWGLAIPAMFTQAIFWPIFITRLVGYPLRFYLLQAMLRPALAVAPFAVACALAEMYWEPSRLDLFFLQMLALLPIYGLGLAAVFHRELYVQWKTPDSLLRRKVLRPVFQMVGRSPEQAVNG